MIITIGRTYGSDGTEIGHRLAERLNIPFYEADAPGLSDEDRIQAIQDMGKLGSGVIVGFCADHILSGTPGLFRVFIYSDNESRARRIARRLALTEEEAFRFAMCRDRERAKVYGYHTKGKWADMNRYDLLVDSGPLGIAGTVELLCQFIALKVMRKRPRGQDHD